MSSLDRQLAAIRPRIELVSPIAGWSVLGFGVLNSLLGVALFLYKARLAGDFSIVSYIFNYQFWGVLFVASGVVFLTGFITNNWPLMRKGLVIDLCYKAIWLVALIMRFLFDDYDNVFLLLIWSGLTFFQALVYIYFMPSPLKGAGHE